MESGQGSVRVLPLRAVGMPRMDSGALQQRAGRASGSSLLSQQGGRDSSITDAGMFSGLVWLCCRKQEMLTGGGMSASLGMGSLNRQESRTGCRTGFAASVLQHIAGTGRETVHCRIAGRSVHRWQSGSGNADSGQFVLLSWCWRCVSRRWCHDRPGCHAHHVHRNCRDHRVVHVRHVHRRSPAPVFFSRIPSTDSLFA